MLENLTLIAIGISALWVAGFAAYLVSSRRQRDLEADIARLEEKLSDE